ncbi:MAG: trypsin-like peptidase domain-containing protein [Candidatus Acidiferrales bacterium]|jgi:S1-C subfamily serine protease
MSSTSDAARDSASAAAALVALSNDLADAAERAGQGVVAIHARHRVPSSGIHWQKGVAIAADHTIKRDEDIQISLPDGRTVPATLAGRDPSTDIAVLKFDAGSLASPEIGDSSSLRIGNLVLAVSRTEGNHLGASFGAVSAAGGAWRTWRGGQIDQFLRLDLAIYIGFSGSALVEPQGRIIGLNTSGLARGLAMAIPVSTVNRVVRDLLSKGHVSRGFLGIGMQPVRLPEDLRNRLKLSAETGAILVSVEPDGPAGKSGLMLGDVLLALDGQSIRDTDDVQAHLGPEKIGKAVVASVLRGGVALEVSVQIGERPPRGR